ncbi:aminotransferase class I/II-fold pyridoxal phosphate-dependent enzyme [Geomicrobium sediminis]|uniref:Cystathionine beta-lyase family protein involved in aluminum resistance n=1 Tax=Geomicrobium sediminis TaxID=1347788 RepID=A0ABS2PCK4_9BACL|nr:methionine gamma-lyase family protein [Geomicrobium sediminis]MBM7632676.1 cystathionine beta-lyase family protein involved in aluminum resistance [Geomicrobium sediminis]
MNTVIQQWNDETLEELQHIYKQIDIVCEQNQAKVLDAYQAESISSYHLNGSDGYGYDDEGRDALGRVYARIFGTEAAIVRPQFVSGTHAITAALFGNLRPGDELVYASGEPYATMKEVVGLNGDQAGNFKQYGMTTKVVPLDDTGRVDVALVNDTITAKTKWVVLQRSCGYDDRPSISIEEMKYQIQSIKARHGHVHIFVDNCYGEFAEELEPGHIGADLLAGSLIKNPGGGITKTGGYIAGKESFVVQASARLAAPGIGMEAGATGAFLQDAYHGLFIAPTVVADAIKGAHYTASMLEKAGYETTPSSTTRRTDLIQAVQFGNAEDMISFCQSIQHHSPIDAKATPIPGPLPGYDGDVIMAAGTFVLGASIELSADGPVAPPYTAYVQGGLTFAHCKVAIRRALQSMID